MKKVIALLALLVASSLHVAAQTIVLDPLLTGLSSPLYVTHARDGSGRLFVVEQGGVIRVLQPGATTTTVFLNITTRVLFSGERGLLGLAFHPLYETNRRFFVYYTRNSDGANVVAEYRASESNPNVADTAETVILPIPQPFTNHNGGMIEFGPDGFLYIGKGDGGSANDPGNRAQNLNELLGKMLRIDINQGTPYASPPTNPFAGAIPGRDEIWAYGLRNPFRFSFDRQTGNLYIGDVGQGQREEVDFQPAASAGGENYGWRIFEGTLCTNLGPASCTPTTPYTFPLTEYAHTGGRCSITGGYVYRGARASLPFGSYVFADFCTGEIFIFDTGGQRLLLDTSRSISSFGEDEAGELYIVGLGGTVERIRNPNAPTPIAAGQLLISEFRLRGPGGAQDEFIEIYNNTDAALNVNPLDGSAGFAVAASDGSTRCTIPTGTIIPARGHFLCANSAGYSLASYPAGNGTTATADATYTTDIPDNAGLALFNTANPISFVTANRLDAAGSTSETNALYKEGAGYPALTIDSSEHSLYRDDCGKGGSITTFGACPLTTPKDTNDNAADFVFVATNGASAGAGQRLGAPGPENLSAPVQRNAAIPAALLDPCAGSSASPNRARDFISDPGNNSSFGTLDLRRTFTNNTGGDVTRLRFRIVDVTTFPAPPGIADLRPLSSAPFFVTVDRAPCGTGTSNITVAGTTLEQPPAQPNGGGFNSSMSAGTVTLSAPLPNGASIDVRFLLGIQQTGSFKFFINVEAVATAAPVVATDPKPGGETIEKKPKLVPSPRGKR